MAMVSAEAPVGTEVGVGQRELGRLLSRHLMSLLLPVNTLAFLFTGPHPWYIAPLFIFPTLIAYILDDGPRVERRAPDPDAPAWPYDLLVYVLAGLQLLAIYGIARMFATQDVFSVDMVMIVVVVGGSSGFSIITAHELIHRPKRWEQSLGRLLLCTVLQEHFYTEHLRGHHARVGLAEDPATARFGETYRDFYRRTVPAQFRSAWRLEARRLGDEQMSLFDPRMVKNRIVHGLIVGWGIAFGILAAFGLTAFVAFIVQAFMASRLLEAVNYFEHWGLMRSGNRVRPRDSWDTHSWFTYYALVGLSRHADHHYEQARPYQQLKVYEDVPMLPSGYIGMVDMVMGKNDEYQQLAIAELRRLRLGPFEDESFAESYGTDADADAADSEATDAPGPTGVRGWWAARSPWTRGMLSGLAFVLAASVGAQVELADLSLDSLFGRVLLSGWILASVVLMSRLRTSLEEQGAHPGWSWAIALSALVAVGLTTDAVLGLFGWA
jgi:alkane 1-monooxygenase